MTTTSDRLATALREGDVAQWKQWLEEGRAAYLKQETAPGHIPCPKESANFCIAYAMRELLAAHQAQDGDAKDAALHRLPRYRPICEYVEEGHPEVRMVEVPLGEYVKLSDLGLSTAPAPIALGQVMSKATMPTREEIASMAQRVEDASFGVHENWRFVAGNAKDMLRRIAAALQSRAQGEVVAPPAAAVTLELTRKVLENLPVDANGVFLPVGEHHMFGALEAALAAPAERSIPVSVVREIADKWRTEAAKLVNQWDGAPAAMCLRGCADEADRILAEYESGR